MGKKFVENVGQENMIKKILCKIGWHSPGKIISDGFQFYSSCRRCGKNIIQDSQGNWF